MTMAVTVPLIDLEQVGTPSDRGYVELVAKVREACADTGFLMVRGHGVPLDLIERVRRASDSFFDLPDSRKLRFEKPSPQVNRGFSAMRSRTVGRDRDPTLRASLQEGFAIGMPDVPNDPYFRGEAAGANFAPNIWPDAPDDFEAVMREYYSQMERLSGLIMRLFARALTLPEDYFADKMDRHISTLRLVHYPALDAPPAPGEERAGAHTDTGTLTILHIDDTPRALQVKTRSGEWIDVTAVSGAFVINIGDMMMRWTNDKWQSTLHRVANPPASDGTSPRRLSIVYFSQPNYDARIECLPGCSGPNDPPRYEPITSGEHRLRRYAKTYGFELPGAA
jgi:isopenicillin N synthase-like dioxygenase